MKLYLFFFLSILSFSIVAQRRPLGEGNGQREIPKIIGLIQNESGEAIPFANVVLYLVADSSLIKGTTSDIDGNFVLETRPGLYYIKVTFLSYRQHIISPVKVQPGVLDVGRIKLSFDSQQLDEVEIVAQRSQMELKLDKRVFNVAADLSNAGANAAEILDNIPSVSVDIEGNISLRGSGNVRVLIDGKPSIITGTSTADVLRQFSGSMIDRVEVITNPSARYDAEGEVGIINIVLKKEKAKGVNGSVEAVAGYPNNHRLSYNLNFRKEHYNFFTSFGIGYRGTPGQGKNSQTYSSPDTSYIYESNSEMNRGSFSQNVRLGTDIFLNDKNTLTIAGFYNYSDEKNKTKNEFLDLYQNRELFQRVVRTDNEVEYDNSVQTSLNYKKTFDRKDKEFTIDLQWSEGHDLEKSKIDEKNFLYDLTKFQQTENLEFNRNYLIQTDFKQPFRKDGLFETGIRVSLRTLRNNYKVEQKNAAGTYEILPQYFDDFTFQEDIYAAYMMFGNKIKRFSYQFGLRSEWSNISTELLRSKVFNSWVYKNLFPSAHLSYELESKNSFQISYSRRINRPGYRYLLPFQTFSNQRYLWRGNPNLQPEYTDSYEFGYLKYFEKGSLFSSIYHRHRTGVIDRITITDELGNAQLLPTNLSVENNYGFEFNLNYKFNKKSNLNSSFNLFRSITEGSYGDINLNNDVYTWSNRSTYKMEIFPKVDFQTSVNYRAPQKTGQGKQKSMYSIDLSMAKDILKGKGTLVASVRDVLNSRKRRSITDSGYLYSESEFQWRSRQFLLSFSYRINQNKQRTRPNNNGNGGGDGEDF